MKLIFLLLFFVACNGAQKGAFEKLDNQTPDTGGDTGTTLRPVDIIAFTPTQATTVLTQTASMVFGVSLASGAGDVTYEYAMGGTSLQNGTSPFYVLAGTSLAAGDYTLTVTARNAISSDTKDFVIRKNSPTAVVTFSPALLGQSLDCGSGSLTFSGVMVDANSDAFTIGWELDGTPVTGTTPFTNITTTTPFSQLVYGPDCTQSGSHTLSLKIYDGYEVTTKTWSFTVNNPPPAPGTVAIQTFTPTADPVVLTNGTSATFAVTVNDPTNVTYEFIQDNSATLQTGSNSFYSLAGATLTSGYHSLKVRAGNGTSTAEKTFNIRKNTAPAVLSFSPALLGATAACASGTITFDAAFTDNDGDALTKTWELDNVNVTGSTAFTTVTTTAGTAQLAYAPDCTKAGSHTLKLTIDDGYESVSKTWTFSITNPPPPPGNVQILTYTPAIEPVVMTDGTSTTFAVSIHDGAGTVSYEFKKDFTTILQTSETPFYVLSGASLSPGVHTLRVKGTNSVSSDEKVFTIRKNTPPAVLSYTPALAGSILNCGQDTLSFNVVMNDGDNDSLTKTWELDSAPVTGATAFTSITNGPASSQLAYTPDCTRTGVHTVALKLFDGYETTTTTWAFTVNNPAVENITSYFPTSNTLTYLSTDTSKTFNASGAGVGALTFKWKLDGVVVKTEANVTNSSYPLPATDMSIGNHTLELILTDSTLTNDPPAPVSRSWAIYRNMKPRFLSVSPSSAKYINLNNTLSLTASIEDASDTFTSVFVRGSSTCTPNGSNASAACGLTGMSLPTTTGTFVSLFAPGSALLGENNFQLRVTDSHGESITQDFTVNANYFSSHCNNLTSGQICTLAGLPGLGSGLSAATEYNKVRVTPAWLTQDDQGNWFFSDHNTNTVWYYNVKATSATIFGLTVPAYSLQIVAGTGIAGTGGNGINARLFALNFGSWGGGLAWDTRDQALYVTDYGNNRVVRISSTGRANTICGLGALTAQGSNANNTECLNPVDVEIDNTNRRLFITTQSRHIIKYLDITNTDITQWTSYTLAGANNTAGSVTGSTNLTGWGATTAGTTRLNQPWGLHLDTTDNILYVTEYGACRVRAIGLPGSTTRTVASQSITSNNSYFLTSGAACASEAINTDIAVAATRFNRPQDIVLEKSGTTINGFYVTDYGGHRISFCNNSVSSATIGNQAIGSQMCNNVLGNGSSTASTIPLNGKNVSIFNPMGMVKTANALYIGDRGYNLIRTMPVNVTNGTVSTFLGGVGRASYSGNAPLDSKLVTFNNPINLMYRDSNRNLYVSDSSNFIIRSINLNDGRVEDFAGGINGNETRTNTTATSTNMSAPRGMAMYDDYFLYADNNNNCFVRAYNSRATNDPIFGTLVNSNRTSPVAGYYNNCGAFVGTGAASTTDPNAKLQNPYGIGVDTSAHVMYVSSRDAHCILRVNDNGTMQPFIGTCGTVAASPVYGDTYNSTNLKLRFPGEIYMDPAHPGNFFFTDFTDQGTAHVKYVNVSVSSGVSINGTTISMNTVETVYGSVSSPGYIRSVAAHDNWVCFTSGSTTSGQGNNTINCYNRDEADTTNLTRFGVAGAGAIQQKEEQEGVSAISATFAAPIGLAFDAGGNLYVTEQGSHVIRMIKKWW